MKPLCSIVLAVTVAATAPAGAEGDHRPVRLALPPAGHVRGDLGRAPLARRAQIVLGLYLRDWLAAAPGIVLADEAWAAAAMDELTGGRRVEGAGDFLADLAAVVPVDAALVCLPAETGVLLRVHRHGAPPAEGRVELSDGADMQAVAETAVRLLSRELGLDPAGAPAFADLVARKMPHIEDLYASRRLTGEWVTNSGMARLELLRPHLTRLPGDSLLAAAILEAATEMSRDGRKVAKPAGYVQMARLALPCVLGGPGEPHAAAFVATNRHLREDVEADLLAIVAEIRVDAAEAILEGPAGQRGVGEEFSELKQSSSPAGRGPSPAELLRRQAGALRCLGLMRSQKALPHAERAARHAEAALREAAAEALGLYPAPTGQEVLKALAGDADEAVAFAALRTLWRRGGPVDGVLPLARRRIEAGLAGPQAAEVLAEAGEAADAPALAAMLDSSRAELRRLGLRGLARLGALQADALLAALADPSEQVVLEALAALTPQSLASHRQAVVALADSLHDPVAEAARQALAPLRPPDEPGQARFDLACEHPYVRWRTLRALAASEEPWAAEVLAEALANREPHARALALTLLAERRPDAARAAMGRLLGDRYRWVRLHAAAIAARLAQPADAEALREALAHERDEVTRLYLADALARCGAAPAPDPPPPARRLDDAGGNVPILCGSASGCRQSPMGGYYNLSTALTDADRQAHAEGKLYLARANQTAKNPGLVMLATGWRDRFWIGLDGDLLPHVEALDGVVLGEESMYFRPWDLWEEGWRLFCREAGLDAGRVAGDRDRLSEPQRRAWWHWEQRVAIEGFNKMYDLVKLRYGRLRPGFQVCTFMPDQNGPCEFDRQWKFDVGAAYHYYAPSRTRYSVIRRFKTLWPERPVLWLSLGLMGTGGVEWVKYDCRVPEAPLAELHGFAYADSLCAYLAGAHSGFFASWLFLHHKTAPGPSAHGKWVHLEDAGADNPVLAQAVEYAFSDVAELYRTQEAVRTVKPRPLEVQPGGDEEDDLTLEEKRPEDDPFVQRAAREKRHLLLGFALEQKLVYDAARLLSGLPHPPHARRVLLVGPPAGPGALALPNDYDYLARLNALAEVDLSGYDLIAIAGGEQAALRDATIEAVAAWLKQRPGLLYIRGWLCCDNANEASTVDDLDGRLAADWPWEADVSFDGKAYSLTGPRAAAMEGERPAARLAWWRGEGLAGGVLFDCGDLPPDRLRGVIAGLKKDKGVGLVLAGPAGLELGGLDGLRAATSCKAAAGEWTLQGLDVLTGIADPLLPPGRAGALVAGEHRARYWAASGGVAVLGEAPLEAAEAVPGGLRVRCSGLMQAVAAGGAVRLAVEGGGQLPAIEGGQELLEWILLGRTEGAAAVPRPDGRGTVTFFRCARPVVVTRPPADGP